jgi:hypothetical protein
MRWEMIQNSNCGTPNEKIGNLNMDRRIVLTCILENIFYEGMYWIQVA